MSEAYDPSYIIELGNVLVKGKLQPHWLNGKTLEEAFHTYDPVTGSSELSRSYKFYKNSRFRDSKVNRFLKEAQAFYDDLNATKKEAQALYDHLNAKEAQDADASSS